MTYNLGDDLVNGGDDLVNGGYFITTPFYACYRYHSKKRNFRSPLALLTLLEFERPTNPDEFVGFLNDKNWWKNRYSNFIKEIYGAGATVYKTLTRAMCEFRKPGFPLVVQKIVVKVFL